MNSPIPTNEAARLEALHQYCLLDTAPEQAFDDITQLASFICSAPIALITFVDADRQWLKSKVGTNLNETPRNISFCSHAILNNELFVVEDTLLDTRFASNPLVTGSPHIRFYAGAPLITPGGCGLGSLCVIDREPRRLSPEQSAALQALARRVVSEMELRRVSADLASAVANIKTLGALVPICSFCKGLRNDQGYWQDVETFLRTHAHANLTHGICPACAAEHFPNISLDPP